MAIQFARCEYVSRSTGGNACRKASYNQRDVVRCERTGELFSFKERGGNFHHEVLLPPGADSRFRSSSALWNEAENCERRKDSQVAKEFVLALPDDKQVTLDDRIELSRRFSQIFVEKGVAVQLDVHSPHDREKNWHAHLLVTTRRFTEDGLTFFSKKAKDLDPVIRGKSVVEANLWGEIWRDLQNDYFQEKGYDLRVDPIGIVPQEHLGPVRMRHHLNEAMARSQLLQKANEKIAQNPVAVLEELTRTRAVFTQKDVGLFLRKHVPENEREGLLEKVLEHPAVIALYHKEAQDKCSKEQSGFFTTKNVRIEEEKLLRFADAIANRSGRILSSGAMREKRTLSNEQRKAYDQCVSSGQNLTLIQGRAGVGKSYVLGAIRETHEASGFRVLGLAPTHKVAMDLKNDGFQESKTCHSFLFAYKNGREKLDANTLVIVDEAGMLGTTLSVELFNVVKKSGAKLILVGDDRQLSSVERGGTFRFLSERYGAAQLTNVRRQSIEWQRHVSESLAEGDIKNAVHLLEENKAIAWNNTKEEALTGLLKSWSKDNLLKSHENRLILAQKNVDVDTLNQGVRDVLRAQGRLGDTELICTTQRGRVAFAEGDRVQFTKTDQEQGLMNASFGIIEHINLKSKKITVRLDSNETKEINPDTYNGLRHGYASTVYKAQGATIDHVYVLHSKTTNQSTNYVALTRQAKSLHLYVSQDETPSPEALIHQMGRQDRNGTSLIFDTQQDIEKSQTEKSFSNQIKQGAEVILTKITDAFHKNEKFYQFEKPANVNPEKAAIVEHTVVEHQFPDGITKESLPQQKSKQRTEIDVSQAIQGQGGSQKRFSAGKTERLAQSKPLDAKVVEEALRQNMASFADDIFSSIGESYNATASSSIERRYGKNGHIAVNLKTGAWIDHKDDSLSGGPLHMLTKLKGLSFKEALEYGANWAGLSQRALSEGPLLEGGQSRRTLSGGDRSWMASSEEIFTEGPFSEKAFLKGDLLEGQSPENTLYKKEIEALRAESQAKIDKAQALWNKGKPLQGTLAERYLREHRKIEGDLPNDLRYLPFFTDMHSKSSFPCLMAGARSDNGDITAVQITFLNAHTAAKADLLVAKRSFGVVKGSAVTLQDSHHEASHSENSRGRDLRSEASRGEGLIRKDSLIKTQLPNILFVAEGVETALSLKSAGVQGTIKASLGLSNIKQITPESPHPHIVICADHDAPDSPATKSLAKSVTFLQERGLTVTAIKPDTLGEDFNDVLKTHGPQGVREMLTRNLPKDLIQIAQTEKEFPSESPGVEKSFIEKKAIEKSTIIPPQQPEEKSPLTVPLKEPLKELLKPSLKKPFKEPLEAKTVSIKDKNEKVFEELIQQCAQKLYAYLGEEKMSLTSDLKKRIETQSEKAANFIFYAHTLKGAQPTDKETKNFLLRAKHEFDRIPEIRQELVDNWQKAGKYKGEKDELVAHMIAERQASIEGRMYLEAKQKGLAPSPALPAMAERELKANRALAETLAQELEAKHHLSKDAATHCAKDMIRFQETHGAKLSAEQMATMAKISRELDKKNYSPSIGSHNVEYLRRRNGELMFREMSTQNKDLSGFKEFPHKEQMYRHDKEKFHKDTTPQPQARNAKSNEMELSL